MGRIEKNVLLVLICKAISMPKNLDPFWEYAEPVDPQNRQKLRCNMCGKEMMGGISRLKYHLAQPAGRWIFVKTPLLK